MYALTDTLHSFPSSLPVVSVVGDFLTFLAVDFFFVLGIFSPVCIRVSSSGNGQSGAVVDFGTDLFFLDAIFFLRAAGALGER